MILTIIILILRLTLQFLKLLYHKTHNKSKYQSLIQLEKDKHAELLSER